MHEFVKKKKKKKQMLLLSVRVCNFYFTMLEQPCPAKVLQTQKPKQMKLSVWTRILLGTEHSCRVTMTMMMMMSKEQWTLSSRNAGF